MPTPPGQPVVDSTIELREVQPRVWRRLLVPGSVRLDKLHRMFQAAMGWEDCHLHAFEIGGEPALAAPYAIRGAFLATFLNEYAALPMAITGSLSDKRAARRVNETASFFATTVLPGGMRRDGPGFEAAAMVRLMHSMVRYNALRRSDRWDQERFGIPIPQVDQMPAGLISSFLISAAVIRAGRNEFDADERAQIEMARYRCFLLGLPEELLPSDPSGMLKVFLARAATLRRGYDDATCGELVRATMSAYLRALTTRCRTASPSRSSAASARRSSSRRSSTAMSSRRRPWA